MLNSVDHHRKVVLRPSQRTPTVLALRAQQRPKQHFGVSPVALSWWVLSLGLLLWCRNEQAHGFVPSSLLFGGASGRSSSHSNVAFLEQIRRPSKSLYLALDTRNDVNDEVEDNPAPIQSTTTSVAPQMFSSGYSTNANLLEALKEAVTMAAQGLAAPDPNGRNVDFGQQSLRRGSHPARIGDSPRGCGGSASQSIGNSTHVGLFRGRRDWEQ
jgi:hypothetical protein